uniref:Inner membrane protein n=1 Tax=Ascaris lumbricoides TaxID=6252 RepID=A0A0M3IP04_ASCLU
MFRYENGIFHFAIAFFAQLSLLSVYGGYRITAIYSYWQLNKRSP